MRVVNGRAIEHYKNFEVRETGLAIPKAEPLYRPAISNGYAPDDFIVDSSLVLYLPLYLLKGGKFKSVDRYRHTCTVTGALWKPNGRWFDADNDLINCGNSTAFDITAAITMEIWFNAASMGKNNYGRLFTKEGSCWYINFVAIENRLDCTIKDSGNTPHTVSLTGVTYNVWHHLALTYDGTIQKVTFDGSLFATTVSWSDTINTDTVNVKVGNRDANDRAWDNLIGEARLYSRALSLVEIQHNRNATMWRFQ